ncbi:MAG: PAS domain-containing protein, partial [Snowella sp.]|nr:PAS domain-containing protein [Snowella sp.]
VSPKILIVDDSESDRFSFVRYLQSDKENSYQIIEVETLEEGLEQWRSQQPDVVLLDINLPDGNGLEFLREIGTVQAINKLPVIMLTGQGDERIAVRAMKLGAADYLVKKDITALLLLTAIRQVQENDLLFQQLRRSQQQQTIIASMALHIRRSLNFEEVANQIVQEIRRFLEADRTIIYRFTPDMSGVIVAEAIIPPWLPCLNAQVEDTCFQENQGGEYQKGKVFAAADIYAANLTECHIELLERFQVRANLVVPILLNGNNTLWGLLIAHQCSAPRQWHEADIQLLHQLSVHLSIALQQAELYQNLQTMNSSLEEKVQERTKKLQLQAQVLEEVHDGVVTTDSNGTILSWNRGAEELYGYTEAEVLGQNIAFLYENVEDLQTKVIAPLLEYGSYTTEVAVFSKSGKRIYISLHLSVVRDEQGQITHLIGCSNDITKRKRAEQELQQLNQGLETKVLERTQDLQKVSERLALALKSGDFGCWEWNLVQNTKFWDERMYELYELSPKADGSISYEDWANRLHPEDLTATETLLQQSILGEAEYDTEFRVLHPDDSIHFIKAYGMLVRSEQGDPQTMIGINFDISDRKQAEAALRASDQRWQFALESAGDGIWDWKVQTNEVFFSQQWKAMLGYADDEIENCFESWENLIHPDDLAYCKQKINQCRNNATFLYENEHRLRCKDGSYKWILDRGKVLEQTDDGQILRMMGTHSDLSDRKRAALELQQLTERLTLALKSGAIGCWDWNITENSIYWDDRMSEIYGIPKPSDQRLTYETWINTVHPEDVHIVENIVQQSAEGISDFDAEFRIVRPDGAIRFIKDYGIVIRDSLGNIQGMIGINFDISDRKQAEQELLENQRLIQQIADSSPNVLYLYDVQEQRNAYANREILTTLGYSVIEVQTIGADWLPSVMHPDDLAPTLEHFEKLKRADDDEIFSHEYRLRHANGQWRYFYSRDLVFSRDAQGQVKIIIGTAQDITDRKLAEVQLQQKNIELQQLVQLREEALTLREDMSNMIVHDLRNPLSGIMLSAEIIKKYGDRPDQQALMVKKAEQILKSGNRLKAMIDSLLLMAKLESGKILFNPVPTDLHELGTAIVSDFELTAQSQRIELNGELPSPGNSIIIDAVILRRVIENLISNALKFSPPNSQVRLQIEYFPENHLRVKVTDNGPGVSPDQAEDIFKKFEIGTVKQNVSQIGLGLAFCKMAVEAQGGTLAIAPNQPQGSIFTLEI